MLFLNTKFDTRLFLALNFRINNKVIKKFHSSLNYSKQKEVKTNSTMKS